MASAVTETVAKGLQQYALPFKKKLAEKTIRRQMQEINGLVAFDKGNYHNQHYENHIRRIVEMRDEYRFLVYYINQRKKIATEELKSWRDYVETRKTELPEDYLITDKMKGKFQQALEIAKDRNDKAIKPSKILKMHEEYVKLFKFEIPIDARNLARLVHPHFGYLSCYPGPLTLEEIMEIYANKIVSGYEEYLGQDILASEIAAYTYWVSIDKDLKGYMSVKNFSEFMKIFRMAVPPQLKGLTEEFRFALGFMQNEFDRDISEADSIVRFDFMRHVFLERNL